MMPEDEMAHLRDELENVKGLTRRLLREEAEMLLTALQALERGKLHVTKDHVERVLDRMAQLRSKLN